MQNNKRKTLFESINNKISSKGLHLKCVDPPPVFPWCYLFFICHRCCPTFFTRHALNYFWGSITEQEQSFPKSLIKNKYIVGFRLSQLNKMTPFSFVMHQWSCRKPDSSSLSTRKVAKVNFLFYLHGKKWNSWKTSWTTWIRGELTGCNNIVENQLETAKKNLLYPRRQPRASLEWFRSKLPHVRKA